MQHESDQTIEKLINLPAVIQGGWRARTVRLGDGKIPLATSTYNYLQTEETKNLVARRIAALWNIAAGLTTEELEALEGRGFKLRKQP